jgi:hypothetical protein
MQTGCFRNIFFRDEYDTDGVRLFRVRGAGDGQVDFRAEQVLAFALSYELYILHGFGYI